MVGCPFNCDVAKLRGEMARLLPTMRMRDRVRVASFLTDRDGRTDIPFAASAGMLFQQQSLHFSSTSSLFDLNLMKGQVQRVGGEHPSGHLLIRLSGLKVLERG